MNHIQKRRAKKTLRAGLILVGALALVCWTVLPLLWMFISSVSPTKHLLDSAAAWLPEKMDFERYYGIFFSETILNKGVVVASPAAVFKRAMFNTILVSACTTVLALGLGGVAAYAFARLNFRFKNKLLMMVLFFQLLPSISLLIPLYMMLRSVGMMDQLISLVIVYTSFVLAYVIWVMSGYFRSIPPDLEASAMIDGCSRVGAYFRIIVPVSAPGFTAVGILSFLMAWDEFMYALMFMHSQSNKTITVAISEFTTQFGVDYGMMMTAGCIATALPVLISILFQKNITVGLTAGAVKG